MATRWFNVREGWLFLTDVKADGVYQIVWQYCGSSVMWVGGFSNFDATARIARDTCRPFAVHPTAADKPFTFATRKQARRAVEAANQALQAAYPMEAPPWATLALVHGWTPPEVSR